ncbi:hypothetical protein ACW73L_09160 [Methylolobus aquaticus]
MNAYRTFFLGLLAMLAVASAAQAADSAASTTVLASRSSCDSLTVYPMVDGVADVKTPIPLFEARDELLTGSATGPDGQQFAYLTSANSKAIVTWWTQVGGQPTVAALIGGTKGEQIYLYNSEIKSGVTADNNLAVDGKLTQVAFCYEGDAAAAKDLANPVTLSAVSLDSLTVEPSLNLAYATTAVGRCVCRTTSTGTRVCFPTGCAR